jgi:Sulfotransferase family
VQVARGYEAVNSPTMDWRRKTNDVLRRTTGYELRRSHSGADGAPVPALYGDRLVPSPVFILCSVRSGSTLLRAILNTHSRIHAPHELHLKDIAVEFTRRPAENSLAELGLDRADVEHLLWDRLLFRELSRSGKDIIVDKTPSNSFIWRRIAKCWPEARFIFLLRHPAAVFDSWHRARSWERAEAMANTLPYLTAVEKARSVLDGHTVRYEELTAKPEEVTKAVCAFLGLKWEPEMLQYKSADEGRRRRFLGDWSEKIRSGQIQPARDLPAPEDIPDELVEISRAWGYLSETSREPASAS